MTIVIKNNNKTNINNRISNKLLNILFLIKSNISPHSKNNKMKNEQFKFKKFHQLKKNTNRKVILCRIRNQKMIEQTLKKFLWIVHFHQ